VVVRAVVDEERGAVAVAQFLAVLAGREALAAPRPAATASRPA
jgi:hypothetical protein